MTARATASGAVQAAAVHIRFRESADCLQLLRGAGHSVTGTAHSWRVCIMHDVVLYSTRSFRCCCEGHQVTGDGRAVTSIHLHVPSGLYTPMHHT